VERVLGLRTLRHADVVYYRPTKSGPLKTLRCHRKLGGCSRLARGAEPIETFLEAAVFEIVRHPAFTQFLTRRNTVPAERGHLLEQARAVEALQQENLVAYAAPEPGERRRSKTEYELIAARLDRQLDLLNKKLRALSTPDLPEALTHGGPRERMGLATLLCTATNPRDAYRSGRPTSGWPRLSPIPPIIGTD
jgi:hypothetical protein